MKLRLFKPYVETFLAFGFNQLMKKPTRMTSALRLLITDHILTNSKEKVSHYGVIVNRISGLNFFNVPGKQKLLKQGNIMPYL